MTDQRRPNILLIMSDEHNPRMTGYAGHDLAKTPNIDRLAERGRVFSDAYCTSPICVPARASLATGQYVHEMGLWDNSAPYAGDPPSWGHYLRDEGYRVTTIGKLHYRSAADDTGMHEQRLAMHVHGLGDIKGVARRSRGEVGPAAPVRNNLLEAGPGESDYTRFDRAVADETAEYLGSPPEQPWFLMASFVTPHFPLLAPQEFYDLYTDEEMTPRQDLDPAWDHPAIHVFRHLYEHTDPLTEAQHRRALRAYLALCSFTDSLVGRVADALEASGQADNTLVVYSSDHGDSAGAHGLWFKHMMNEESVGVPLILAGPGIDHEVVDTPVSQIDLFATFMDWTSVDPGPVVQHARSLLDVDALVAEDRPVMAEYHANGTIDGIFMLRDGRYKYIEYIGERPQLFDLDGDPFEHDDLAGRSEYAELVVECARRLREICDPDEVDAAAKADQDRRVAEVGGFDAALEYAINFTPTPRVD